jgi:hypothetical protein
MPAPLRAVFGLLKAGCIAGGLPLTVLCLMALVGAASASGWARLIVGLVAGIGLPLLIVDRLMPEDASRGQGVMSDGLALIYVALPLAFAGLAHGLTSRTLAVEGDRLAAAGWPRVGALAYWLGSVEPEGSAPTASGAKTAAPKKAGSGASTARADAGAARDRGPGRKPDARRADAAPTKLTPAEIFRSFAGSVVYIKSESGGGTGFLIDAKGTIATNSHVIRNASDVEIKLKDGTSAKEVDLLVEDQETDLALLAIKVDKLPKPLRLGDSDGVTVGEQAVAIGNPLGLEHTLTDGLISARRVFRGKRWLQISVPLSPGNSGGPLFNMLGEVIGVNTATVSMFAQNLNLAVPVNELKKLIKDSYPGRRSIGATSPGTW